jgi:hypothetical protein
MLNDNTFYSGNVYTNGYTREQAKMSVGIGWHSLIDMVYDKRSTMQYPPTIIQVKEKFGGLRIYYAYPTDDGTGFEDLVIKIEKQSYTVCEECGKPGSLRKSGWYRTLCDDHANGTPAIEPFV